MQNILLVVFLDTLSDPLCKGSCSFKSVTGWVIWNGAKSVSFLCLILNLNMVQIADKYFNVTYCNYLYDKAH